MLLSLAASSTGCAGPSPWGPGGNPDLPPPVTSTAQSDNSPLSVLANYDGESTSFAQPSLRPPQVNGAAEKSFGAGISSAVGSAIAKTKDALTIKPKVIPAPDPLSLSNESRDVGPEIYFASARMQESQGNVPRADELYRKALEEAPKDLGVLLHYARMHDRAGNLDRAVEIYRQAISAHPQDAAAYNDLGLCLARQERYGESADALRRAVDLQQDNPLYRNNLAAVLVELGRNDEALSHLAAAHGPAVAHYNLGYLLFKSDKPQQAAPFIQKALALDPQMAPARQLLAVMSGEPQAGPQRTVATAASTRAPVIRPQALPQPDPAEEAWGDAPHPDSLPQLLPPVN
jgi:tetratricopeptide (TPR) repeat protein